MELTVLAVPGCPNAPVQQASLMHSTLGEPWAEYRAQGHAYA